MDRAFKALDEIHSTEIAFPSRSLQGDCSPSGNYIRPLLRGFRNTLSYVFHVVHFKWLWYHGCVTVVLRVLHGSGVRMFFVETFTCVCDVILVDIHVLQKRHQNWWPKFLLPILLTFLLKLSWHLSSCSGGWMRKQGFLILLYLATREGHWLGTG